MKRDTSEEWQRFVTEHGDTKGYAHFDLRTSLRNPDVQEKVCDPDWVSSHGFYPFIQFTINRNPFIWEQEKHNIKTNKDLSTHNLESTERTIYYASHLDRCIYQRYAFLLNKQYQEYIRLHGFSDAAIAYRSDLGKSNIDFAKQAFDFITDLCSKNTQALIFVSDFSHFFESLDHDVLKEKICKVQGVDRLDRALYHVLESVTKYAYWTWENAYKIRLYCKNLALREHTNEVWRRTIKSIAEEPLRVDNDQYELKTAISKAIDDTSSSLSTEASALRQKISQLKRQSGKKSAEALAQAKKKLKDINQQLVELGVLRLGLKQNRFTADLNVNLEADDIDLYSNDLENAPKYKLKYISRREMNASKRIIPLKLFKSFKLSCLYRNWSGVGIPQGAPISAVLANIYMIDFDQALNEYVQSKNGLYLRYSDDFIVILPVQANESSADDLAQKLNDLKAKVSASLTLSSGLSLNKQKTHTFLVKDQTMFALNNSGQADQKAHLDFLGFRFDGKGIKVDPALIGNYYFRMRSKAKTIVDCDFMTKLNHRISCHELYRLYSDSDNESNFISYLQRCSAKMKLDDPETMALLKHSKRKIANTLNRMKKARNEQKAAELAEINKTPS